MTEKKTPNKTAKRPETAKRPKAAKPKAAPSAQTRILRITLLRSPISETYRHKATIRALGLRQIRQTVEQADTPQLRGMLAKINHMVKVEDGAGKEKSS
ncbi:MAG: 50S ribosomal protein L30 [Anaerolineales bacterium]|nr:50S ribosomal protein L30 [Anaerolineales bacterium]